MSKDFFAHKANDYDQEKYRVNNVENIANAVIANTNFNKNMHVMDFGSGTGLLLERVAPYVGKITAVDISTSMNEQLDKKRGKLNCEIEILEMDLHCIDLNGNFDGIISSMTMHHIKDIGTMFAKFYALLKSGGFIAVADLDTENGSFHTEDTGVHHFGFDREEISTFAMQVGFREVEVVDASVVKKPYGDFPVFLLIAKK